MELDTLPPPPYKNRISGAVFRQIRNCGFFYKLLRTQVQCLSNIENALAFGGYVEGARARHHGLRPETGDQRRTLSLSAAAAVLSF